ncbi:MAG: ComF family protein [Elusimicrobiota bacterium]
MSLAGKIIKIFWNLILPHRCAVCRKIIDDQNSRICLTCFKTINYATNRCLNCGMPVTAARNSCAVCKGRKRSYDSLCVVFYYNAALRKLIHRLKYSNKKYLISEYRTLLFRPEINIKRIIHGSWDYIIPVPLHKKRLRKRGFNQAELIAHLLHEKISTPINNSVLIRSKNTKPLFGLSEEERKNELKDAFSINNPILLKNKRILLVDDIATTGATLHACAKLLKRKAGAGCVDAFVFSAARSITS